MHLSFLSWQEYVTYLEDYARNFKLNDKIHFNCKVTSIERVSGKHLVSFVRRTQRLTSSNDNAGESLNQPEWESSMYPLSRCRPPVNSNSLLFNPLLSARNYSGRFPCNMCRPTCYSVYTQYSGRRTCPQS